MAEQILTGLDAVIADAQRLKERADDTDTPLRRSAFYMLGSVERNFIAGGRPTWAGLAESTLKRKSGGSILDESGKMRHGNVPAFSGGGWQIKNEEPYSRFHLGTSKMPARVFLLYQPEDVDFVSEHIFMRHYWH